MDPIQSEIPPVGSIKTPVCTEGKMYSDLSAAADGYTLLSIFRPGEKPASVVLIDMEGKVVNNWKLRGYPAKMMPDGAIMGHRLQTGPPKKADEMEKVIQVNWHGKIVWHSGQWISKEKSTMMSRQHHDIQLSPNPVGYFAPGQKASKDGNYLILSNDVIKAPAISDKALIDDIIYEVKADGSKTGFIWHASKHIDEMGFSAADREEIRKNPNFSSNDKAGDWIHLNAISTLGRNPWYEQLKDERFHPDNIMISSRQANIIAIISRKTKKIVWRVGPSYDKGQPGHELGQIVGQHHAHIIPYGLPGAGNVLLFDNGGLAGYGENRAIRTYSRVLEFNPITMKKVWEYRGKEFKKGIFSMLFGSAQRLPNGNTLLAVGMDGQLLEVNSAGKTVWSFKTVGDPDGTQRYLYRAYRLPPEWLPNNTNPAGYATWETRFSCPK